jgi:hypothetical protein
MSKEITAQQFVGIFSDPKILENFALKQWEVLLRVLRGADMLGSFYYFLENHAQLKNVPEFALKHLISAKRYADRQVQQIKAETSFLQEILAEVNCQPLFLKGAAYVLNQSTNHFGRVMSDIDILVPKKDLAMVEQSLKKAGWREKKLDDYDEQYYRKWAHELPPFTHPERGVTLDVHHTIIPPITGIAIPAAQLFARYQVTDSGKHTLSAEMVIVHCIVHLFYNEDYEKSFRDILDIHLLLQDYEVQHNLVAVSDLANTLGFSKELYYALTLCDQLFNTQRVTKIQAQSTHFVALSSFNQAFIRLIMLAALMPSHDIIDSRWNKFARFVMFLRGHFLKMPLKILLPHFVVKTRRAMVMLVMGPHHYEK